MSQEITELYTKGEYLHNNPGWHSERSAWKADHVQRGLEKAGLNPTSVCDIGCGTGLALAELVHMRPSIQRAVGFEPSQDAPIHPKAKDSIEFRRENALESSETFDLSMMLDVFEHVEDYIGFIRGAARLARHHAFHIPLDATVASVISSGFAAPRRSLGHLHYFTRASAIATLQHCGLKPIHWHFTKSGWEGPPSSKNRRNPWSTINILRRTTNFLSPEYAHRLFGGLSLLVIAETITPTPIS